MELTDQHLIVMLGIRDHATYRDMASTLDRSVAHIQALISSLSEDEYITKKTKEKRTAPWLLTLKGREVLKKNGYQLLS
jgi:hypothetical protein